MNPSIIFNIKTSAKTFIEVEMEEYTLSKMDLKTKVRWSPFEGMKITGRVKTVVIRNKKVFENGGYLLKKGDGKIIFPKE